MFSRVFIFRCLLGISLLTEMGCQAMRSDQYSLTKKGLDPRFVYDLKAQNEADALCNLDDLYRLGEEVKRSRKPTELPPKKSILVLSGGGTFGAYTAGLLVGWTRQGNRPNFDVVTGVSTGALIASLAFLGPEKDSELEQNYTTITNSDVFRQKFLPRGILSESLADNAPLSKMILRTITPEYLARVAEEHRKGRRLYIGTTEFDSRQGVIWDMGAIAIQGTQESRSLFCKILLASSAIPGFFPPVRIPVTVDGKSHEEIHVDGGVTNALFARPPWVPDGVERNKHDLYDSDLYCIVAGKLYADPQPIPLRALNIAAQSVSTLIYSQTRDQLFKLYTVSMLTGMNYRLASIPETFEIPGDATNFDPVVMRKMFDEGIRQMQIQKAWRDRPPGLEHGEGAIIRSGTQLNMVPVPHGNPVVQPPSNNPFPSTERGIPVGPGSMKQ